MADPERANPAPSKTRTKSDHGLDPSRARERLNEAALNPNIHERISESVKIIRELCESGYTDEAWGLIDANKGTLRYGQLNSFFRSANLSIGELQVKMNELEPSEKGTPISGHLSSIKFDDLKTTLESGSLDTLKKIINKKHPEAFKNIISGDLFRRMQLSNDKEGKTLISDLATELHDKNFINDVGYAGILDMNPSLSTFEKFERFTNSSKDNWSAPETDRFREKAIKSMIASDAGKALNLISAANHPNAPGDMLTAIENYGSMDPVGANKWYVDNLSNLRNQQRDAAATAFFNLALKGKETDGAKAWMEQIQDPKIKKWAMGRLGETARSGN